MVLMSHCKCHRFWDTLNDMKHMQEFGFSYVAYDFISHCFNIWVIDCSSPLPTGAIVRINNARVAIYDLIANT